jgi:outer membrane lipoprotein SlyB
VIASIAITVFSLLGIASITGHLPGALAEAQPAVEASAQYPVQVQARTQLPAQAPANMAELSIPAAVRAVNAGTVAHKAVCTNCGVVESVRAVETQGSGTGLGAILGGLGGAIVGSNIGAGNGRTAMTLLGGGAGAYAGNEIEKNNHRRVTWQTRVRMDNGIVRTLTTSHEPQFAAGSKVRIVDGQLLARA